MNGPRTRRVVRRGTQLLTKATLTAVRRIRPVDLTMHDDLQVPEGRPVSLPGRGETFVTDVPGPTPDAPVLLLFHGLGTTAHLTWFTAIGALAQRYRVVTFDQRWHGRGIRSDRFRLDDCVDDAAALLDLLGIERATVVGYSMGGALAQVFWRRHAPRVSGMVLCSTAMRWHGNVADRSFFSFLRVVNHWLHPTAGAHLDDLASELPPHPAAGGDLRAWARAELLTTSPWSLPEVLGELGRYDSSTWIRGVAVPTAVVITAKDRAIPTARQRELAESIPDAIVREAPGGHTSLALDTRRWLPVFLDAVAAVAPPSTQLAGATARP